MWIVKRHVMRLARRLHEDERGAEQIGTVLTLGLVAIPLILLMVVFGGDLIELVDEWATDLFSDAEEVHDSVPDSLRQ